MTLVELLVVIILVTTLVSTAIPIISPGGDNKRLREASRNLNAYLQGAQARAIETGRPFGVAFQRLSADTEREADNAVCIRAEYVEVPPHFSGMDSSSQARVCVNAGGQLALQFVRYGNAAANDGLPPGFDIEATPNRFLRPGDTVVVGKQTYELRQAPTTLFAPGLPYAPIYTANPALGYFNTAAAGVVFSAVLAGPDTASVSFAYNDAGAAVGAVDLQRLVALGGTSNFFATAPTPYQAIRQPVPAGGEPLEMPAGVAVDLQASVFLNEFRVYEPELSYNPDANEFVVMPGPVMVMFSPQGNIDRFVRSNRLGQLESTAATSTLALCVGRRELIPPKQTDSRQSLAPPENFNEPINLKIDVYDRIESGTMSETEAKIVMDQYNWLNLDSRWVLIGGQSGAISTIANSGVFPSPAIATMRQQLAAALENAPTRTTLGGR